uniref:Uncharacterized protein n=1 Tax=Romanomermis culicivorax TaxID=13658 RepID=A0A915JI81_ROMCU
MPTNSGANGGGGGAQTPAPTPPPQPTTPADPAAACAQAVNDQTPEAHKYDKLVNAFRKCSRSGGNGGQPGAAGSSPSGGSPGAAGGGPSPPGGFSGSGGSAMNVGGVNAGDQTNVNSSPGGDTSISNKKGIDGIYTEDNQTSAGKDGFQSSSKKCIAGQFCTESGLGGGRR